MLCIDKLVEIEENSERIQDNNLTKLVKEFSEILKVNLFSFFKY